MKWLLIFFLLPVMTACNNQQSKTQEVHYKKTGSVERIDPSLDSIIDADAGAEIIAEGFEWSEGPLWVEKYKMLLFSDVPANTIYKWTEEKGKEVYLKPSGFTGTETISKEPGSNGLLLDNEGRLVLCQHGDRRMARMDAPLNKPGPKFITLADRFQGKKFSSPNDAVYNSIGELFFTDPPYGLQTQDDTDPKKEISFNGVYKADVNGNVSSIWNNITRPNGLAFFPGTTKLLVACSDPANPDWYLIDIVSDSMTAVSLFYSATEEAKQMKGLPDGLKIDKNGNVFATGPGGLYILNSEGKLLGKLKLENAASNCAFSPDEKTLYITNDMYVLRLKMRK